MSSPLQVFAPLSPAVEAALRASIQRFGVIVPVVRDQHGRTIDGHHRARIAEEMGVEYKVDVRQVADDEEAHALARTLNADRRHLTEEQRKEVVALLAAETVVVLRGREEIPVVVAKHSANAIAGALGVSEKTIRDDISQLRTDTKLHRPSQTVGSDGKVRPSRRALDPDSAMTKRGRNRRPLRHAAKDAALRMRLEIEKLERLFADDRLPGNAEQVALLTRGHLLYAVETAQRLLDLLDKEISK